MNGKYIAWLLATIMVLSVFAIAVQPASAAGPNKTQLTINAPLNVYSLQTFDISGKLVAATAGAGIPGMTVSVYRSSDGKKWSLLGTSVTDSGGYYKVSTSESAGGKYMYRAQLPGGKVFAPATSDKATVTVDAKKATALTINAPASVYTDEMCTLRAYLKDAAGNPLTGQQVEFKIDGSPDTTLVQTEANGLACKSYIGLAAGQHTIQVTFYGAAGYATTTSTLTVEVKERPPTVTTLTLDQPNPALAGELMTFTGTLTAADNAVMYGKEVRIQVYNPDTKEYGDFVTTATDGVGAFSVSKALNNEGTYQVRAVYAGGNGYAGDTSDPKNVEVKFNPKSILTLTTDTDKVPVGDAVQFTAKLVDYNGVGIPDKPVKIEYYSPDSTVWFPVGDGYVRTDANGEYNIGLYNVYPVTFKYRAVFEGDDYYIGATSGEVWVIWELTPTTLDLSVSPNPATSGEPITYSGTLKDANGVGIPGVPITLQFTELSTGSSFTLNTQTGASGEYQHSEAIGARTDFKVKAIFDGTTSYVGSESAEIPFTVN